MTCVMRGLAWIVVMWLYNHKIKSRKYKDVIFNLAVVCILLNLIEIALLGGIK